MNVVMNILDWLESYPVFGGAIITGLVLALVPRFRHLLWRGARNMFRYIRHYCKKCKENRKWKKVGMVAEISTKPKVLVKSLKTGKCMVEMEVTISYRSQDDQNVNRITEDPTVFLSTLNVGRVVGFRGKRCILHGEKGILDIPRLARLSKHYHLHSTYGICPILENHSRYTIELGEVYVPNVATRKLTLKGKI